MPQEIDRRKMHDDSHALEDCDLSPFLVQLDRAFLVPDEIVDRAIIERPSRETSSFLLEGRLASFRESRRD
jgi:hypothetical protein